MRSIVEQGLRDAWREAARWWLPTMLLACVTLLLAARLVEDSGSATAGLPRVVTIGVALPLFAFGLAARATGSRSSLMRGEWARHGESRRAYAVGRLCMTLLLLGLTALLLSGAVVAYEALIPASRGAAAAAADSPQRLALAATCTAFAYGPAFALAQLWKGTWGRSAYVVLDWMLGSATGLIALPWPRSHGLAVLQGDGVAGLPPWASVLALVSLGALAVALYAHRVPR